MSGGFVDRQLSQCEQRMSSRRAIMAGMAFPKVIPLPWFQSVMLALALALLVLALSVVALALKVMAVGELSGGGEEWHPQRSSLCFGFSQ